MECTTCRSVGCLGAVVSGGRPEETSAADGHLQEPEEWGGGSAR